MFSHFVTVMPLRVCYAVIIFEIIPIFMFLYYFLYNFHFQIIFYGLFAAHFFSFLDGVLSPLFSPIRVCILYSKCNLHELVLNIKDATEQHCLDSIFLSPINLFPSGHSLKRFPRWVECALSSRLGLIPFQGSSLWLIACCSPGNIRSELQASNQLLQDLIRSVEKRKSADSVTEVLRGGDIVFGCDRADRPLMLCSNSFLVNHHGSQESTELRLLILVCDTWLNINPLTLTSRRVQMRYVVMGAD